MKLPITKFNGNPFIGCLIPAERHRRSNRRTYSTFNSEYDWKVKGGNECSLISVNARGCNCNMTWSFRHDFFKLQTVILLNEGNHLSAWGFWWHVCDPVKTLVYVFIIRYIVCIVTHIVRRRANKRTPSNSKYIFHSTKRLTLTDNQSLTYERCVTLHPVTLHIRTMTHFVTPLAISVYTKFRPIANTSPLDSSQHLCNLANHILQTTERRDMTSQWSIVMSCLSHHLLTFSWVKVIEP